MKLISLFVTAFLAFFLVIGACFFGIGTIAAKQLEAADYSPLDFVGQKDNFQIIVGIDAEYGRFYTIRYEYAD